MFLFWLLCRSLWPSFLLLLLLLLFLLLMFPPLGLFEISVALRDGPRHRRAEAAQSGPVQPGPTNRVASNEIRKALCCLLGTISVFFPDTPLFLLKSTTLVSSTVSPSKPQITDGDGTFLQGTVGPFYVGHSLRLNCIVEKGTLEIQRSHLRRLMEPACCRCCCYCCCCRSCRCCCYDVSRSDWAFMIIIEIYHLNCRIFENCHHDCQAINSRGKLERI